MLVPANSQRTLLLKKVYKFKLKLKNEPQVDLRHLIYYILLWITCVDNYYNIHHVLKAKISRYPRRMEWNNSKKKFWDAKVMHKWHLLAVQYSEYLSVKPGRFIIKECLSGHQ